MTRGRGGSGAEVSEFRQKPTPYARSFRRRFLAFYYAVNHAPTDIIPSLYHHSFSPKMCRKNFENLFTNKYLTSQNVFEQGFLHGEIVSKGSHYFPGKN